MSENKVGSFTYIRSELVGKNKTHIVKCQCGKEKRFWKYSAITKQKTCGCGTDSAGLTKEKRRMLKSRLNSYRRGAYKRGLDWSISYEDFAKITLENCAYCNKAPQRLNYFENAPSLQKDSPNSDWEKYSIYFNGLDRIDSDEGYSLDNVVPCCKYCNRAKSDMSFDDFKLHIEEIYKWLHLKE